MGNANILVVDDEVNILDSMRGILTDEGYSVATAQNGDDALRILQEKHYDLVLLDIWLPGRRDGLQTLREIRRRNLPAEVVMISGHGTIETAVRATKLGAFDFIEKPLSLAGLLETIDAALRHAAERAKAGEGREQFKYVTGCEQMEAVRRRLAQAAGGSTATLILGEAGTGKEYSARYLHSLSPRYRETFIKVACRRLTAAGFDGLFGPASQDPLMHGSRFSKLKGTVFLENPHFLETALQQRLAGYMAAAAGKTTLAFVAAITLPKGTGDVPRMAQALVKRFGESPIVLPPLRERGKAIRELIGQFLHDASEDFGKVGIHLSKVAMEAIASHPWPGNVKQLKNILENTVMACPSMQIEPEDIPFDAVNRQGEVIPSGIIATAKPAAGHGAVTTQKTVGKSVVLCGLGIHSGIKTGLILAPLPANSGIIFGDISSGRQVRATIENVESTDYATTLKFGTVSIRTIEHVMAVLHMYGITNALLKVGDEVPIMDGSAIQLCEMIERAEIVDQGEPLEPLVIRRPILIGEKDDRKKYLLAEPCDRLVVEYRMAYPPPVGTQQAVYDGGGVELFRSEIAPARTFGFVEQIKKLEEKGLAEGGKLSNVILIDDERVINTTLRFENEFSRHKVLDLLGDLYLSGRPVIGKITGNLTGHTENVLLVRKIRELINGSTNDHPAS